MSKQEPYSHHSERPCLTTERLRLRPFTLTDAVPLRDIMMGKDILRYFPGSGKVTLPGIEKMVSNSLVHWEVHGCGLWAIELRADNALIGRCGLQIIPETEEVEIDFIVDREYWDRGIATEAGRAALTFGFDTLRIDTIVGIVHPENLASKRVLEKLGLRFITEARYFGMNCHRYARNRSSRSIQIV